MWANINPTYSYNKTHTHPNSLWSGVYYVKVPKNSGKLFIEDPRPGPNTYMPRRMDNLPKQLWRVVAYDAIEGRLVFFPSWLPHGVDINMNTDKGELENIRTIAKKEENITLRYESYLIIYKWNKMV
jgi:uncharacterized protein (TIGR02466 family)